MQKIVDFLNSTFGDAGKWILLTAFCIIAVLVIILGSLIVANLKWILLGAAIFLVLVGVGLIVYKKVKVDRY